MTNLISGSGRFTQAGSGQTVLSANNAYTGMTEVLKGSLHINGDQGAATGATVVAGAGHAGRRRHHRWRRERGRHAVAGARRARPAR